MNRIVNAAAPNHEDGRRMLTVRLAIGVIWVVCFMAGRMDREPARPLGIAATSAEITDPATASADAVVGEPLVEDGDPADDTDLDPRFDLFGNEIEEAVADYRVDRRGSLYERHSPDTAVPKPGTPKT